MPCRAVDEVGIEAVLQPEQNVGRFDSFSAPDDMPEVLKSFDAGSGDDQGRGARIAVRGEGVRQAGRNDQ